MEVKAIAVFLLQMPGWRVLPLDSSIFDIYGVSKLVKIRSTVVVSLCILSVPPHESLSVNHACSLPLEILHACEIKDSNDASAAVHRVIEVVLGS